MLKKGQLAGPNASGRRMATAVRFIRMKLQHLWGFLRQGNQAQGKERTLSWFVFSRFEVLLQKRRISMGKYFKAEMAMDDLPDCVVHHSVVTLGQKLAQNPENLTIH